MSDLVPPSGEQGSRGEGGRPQELAAATQFDLIWSNMAELLGTAATAALLRRAARYAADRAPGLNELLIERNGPTYHYEIPSAWHEAGNEQALSALAALGDELVPILLELTGSIVIHRLERFSSLREVGIHFSKESAS